MIDPVRLLKNTKAAFCRRDSHDVPLSLAPPPSSWEEPFGEMAAGRANRVVAGRRIGVSDRR